MNLSKKDIENIIEEHFLLKDHLIVTNITFNYKDDSGNYPPYDERRKETYKNREPFSRINACGLTSYG